MTDPRQNWVERIYQRTATAEGEMWRPTVAPAGLSATPGAGQVTLDWSPVPGAVGYLIRRSESPAGQWIELDHGNSDVRPVVSSPYCDADVVAGVSYRYTIAAVGAVDHPAGPQSEAVEATPRSGPAEPMTLTVETDRVVSQLARVWRMIGSERLSQLWLDSDEAGNPVGQEFRAALADAHTSLGVDRVRAHAIFHDDVGVFRMVDGKPAYNFSGVERIVDELISIGLRPVLELGFMPRDLATDPDATVFTYRGIISPPTDWSLWGELCGRLAAHLVDRYGIDEVETWGFEVWNEPDLEVFWTASREEYFRLYDEAARAIKAVDRRLPVGGPATAAVDWIEEFAAHVTAAGSPVDFVSTHSYGNVPVNLRPLLARHGLDAAEIWWTEWGVGHTHFAPVHDTPYGAAFVLRGMKSAQRGTVRSVGEAGAEASGTVRSAGEAGAEASGTVRSAAEAGAERRGTVDALAYWVISDHFEELGRPPRLFHGGFGLLSVGNLRKPRYWALRLAQELGDDVVATTLSGDGADGLVEAWAARRDDGSVDVLLWNATPTAAKFAGDAALDRTVSVRLTGLPDRAYRLQLHRIDNVHTNIAAQFDGEWPDAEEWRALRDADRLDETELASLTPGQGEAIVEIALPMPGVARIRLTPVE